jgi:predicted nucleic acid-binding protein
MVLFDNTFLCLLFHPTAKPPNDSNGKPITRCQDRIDHLVSELEEAHAKIIVPTPALSELLTIAGPNYVQYLNEINGRSCFKVADFDQRAAIEAALRMADAIKAKDKRSGTLSPLQKIKFDRQIVAIAKVENVKVIYSDDKDIKALAEQCGIAVVRVEDLPLPPPVQVGMFASGTTSDVQRTAEITSSLQTDSENPPKGQTAREVKEKS